MIRNEILKAALATARADYAVAKANASIYLENPAGIGEHGDIVQTFLEHIDVMADAQDRINLIEELMVAVAQ